MRLQRYGLILLSVYLVFGSSYYNPFPAVRYAHHLLLTVLIVGWLGRRVLRGQGLPPAPLNAPLLATVAVWFLSVPFSLDPRMALENLWFPLTHIAAYVFVVHLFRRAQHKLLMEVVFLVTALFVLLAGLQVLSVLFGWGIIRAPGQGWIDFLAAGVPLPWQTDLRIWVPLGVSTWVAGFAAPLIPITAAWALSVRYRAQKFVLWALVLALLLTLALTFSRGGLLSLGVAMAVFAGLRMVQVERLREWATGRNLALVGALFALLAVLGIAILVIGTGRGRASGDAKRADLWRSAAAMITDHPLTGVGVGEYGRALRDYRAWELVDDRFTTAHNAYLNSAAETGLLTWVVGGWALVVLLRAAWERRNALLRMGEQGRLLRLYGMLAALAGIAAHNAFDTLNITASVLLLIVAVVYVTVEPARSRLETAPRGHRGLAAAFALLMLLYGGWFLVIDQAQRHYQNSLALEPDEALSEIERAIALDPALTLYRLQEAFLLGERYWQQPGEAHLQDAVVAYEAVLELEPTWDVGWLNLGVLYEWQGNPAEALAAYWRAWQITPQTPAGIHWARLAEASGTGAEEDILAAYTMGIRRSGYLPLSAFWTYTAWREQAMQEYGETRSLDVRYRIAAAHFPQHLPELLPDEPQSAAEWWVAGEYALTVEGDAASARDHFSQAILLAPGNGDYYVSRARATWRDDPQAALRDLDIARFVGTRYEYPAAVQRRLVDGADEFERLSIQAVPLRAQSQNFEGVLFGGRVAGFMPFPSGNFPGPGNAIMQPWYDLAVYYREQGNVERTLIVYEALLRVAPEELPAAILWGYEQAYSNLER